MSRHLVLVGAGHAHLAVLAELETFVAAGHRVTVVSPDDFHYYSGM
jgi:NADH dehydrogenase FAD-containing subunit